MQKHVAGYVFTFLIAFMMALVVVARRGPDRSTPAPAVAMPVAATTSPDSPGGTVSTALFRNIARQVNPVVVFITTQSRPRGSQGGDDALRRFFGGPPGGGSEVQRSLGSGFLISGDGEILTNNHVVADADEIRVGLYNNERVTYVAKVVGRDPLTDSALIKLSDAPRGLPAAVLGDSDQLEPGDWVMAIGNPFRLGHTVTVGVVSYKGRPFEVAEGRSQDMLQTDASINPGNSGGPLINVNQEVIGINTAILSGDSGGGNIGIGFAVPINTIKALLPQLRGGKVHRGRLGVHIRSVPITEEEAKSLGLPKPEGALVITVEPGSPAEEAGLRAGDVIVEFNGAPIADAAGLTSRVASTAAGTRVSIAYYRDNTRRTASARVEQLE